jgi:hypothetical protein
MKFGVPLMLPTSLRVFRCYASHGKGYGFTPLAYPCAVCILAVNAARDTRWEDGTYEGHHEWTCPALAGQGEWRRLGAMADASLPVGELDTVDPDLTQFDYLPMPHSAPQTSSHMRPIYGG